MKKQIWIWLWVLILLAVFTVTLVSHSPYFLLGGSSSVAPVMEELLHKYPNNEKNGDFNYVSSASSGAPLKVETNLFGIGWLSKEYTTTNPKELFTFQLMSDGLIIVYNLPNLINPSIPLDFNPTKIQQLYLYNKSWDEVFPDRFTSFTPAKLFTRPNGSGTREVFDSKVLNNTNYYKANTTNSSSEMLNLEPGGIGYSSFADFNQAKNILVKAGKWKTVEPTFDNIKNRNYKLSRPFVGLIKRNYKYKKEIANLLKWIFSSDPEVEKIFQKYGPKVELDEPINEELKKWLAII